MLLPPQFMFTHVCHLDAGDAISSNRPDTSVCDIQQLTEACLVLDVLGEESKQKIVTWFVNLQVRLFCKRH